MAVGLSFVKHNQVLLVVSFSFFYQQLLMVGVLICFIPLEPTVNLWTTGSPDQDGL
jgi:hypothetical protein